MKFKTGGNGSHQPDGDMCHLLQDTALFDAMDSIGHEVAEVREPGSSGGDFID